MRAAETNLKKENYQISKCHNFFVPQYFFNRISPLFYIFFLLLSFVLKTEHVSRRDKIIVVK